MFKVAEPDRLDLAALFEASPNPYLILDPRLVIVGMNRACLRVLMRDREALIGRALFEAFPGDPQSLSYRLMHNALHRVLESGRPERAVGLHYPIARPDGRHEDRCWNASWTPMFDVVGSVAYVLQHLVDTSEARGVGVSAPGMALPSGFEVETEAARGARHEAEARQEDHRALDTERSLLRSLFAQAPGFMAVLRGPSHVFELANEAYLDLVGRHRQVVGRALIDVLPEAVEQGFGALLDHVLRSGEPYVGRGLSLQLQRGPDAPLSEIVVDFVYQPWRNARGEVEGIFVQGTDITSQQLARRAAEASEQRFRTLAHAMPVKVWTASPDGRIQWMNARLLDDAAGHYDEAAGWPSLLHAQDMAAVTGPWQQALTQTRPYETECRMHGSDGRYRWHLLRIVPTRGDDGRLQQWIGTATDIEDRKSAESLLASEAALLEQRVAERTDELMRTQDALRQSQKMESIGNLAGGIAHDFNNLLQVINGNLQLIIRQVSGQTNVEGRLKGALAAVRRGARLSSQLLAFGRRQPLEPRVLDIGRLVREMDEILRRTLGAGIDIEMSVADDLWHTLVDPTNIESAVLNLAINARDAMGEKGRLTLEVANVMLDRPYSQAHADVQPGAYVMLAVSDTGCGVPPEHLKLVFEPFFTTKPVGRGSGLGLAMVYGFIKQSGGHVKIYSEPGSGTTLKLYFPRVLREEEADPAGLEHLPAVGGHETVLVAEDDDAVSDTTVAMLEELGYRVLRARDAQAALAVIESGVEIDLLFTDVVMPGLLHTTELVRLAQLRLPQLAVLYTSGYTENAIVHAGRLDRGVHLLGKPFTREQLAHKLRLVLAQRPGFGPAAADPAPG